MATPYSRADDATESSEDHPTFRAIRASAHARGLPRLMPQDAFSYQARHVRHHGIAQGLQALWSAGNPRRASENRGLAYPLLTFRKLNSDTNPAD
jgi:hypothetical protein